MDFEDSAGTLGTGLLLQLERMALFMSEVPQTNYSPLILRLG